MDSGTTPHEVKEMIISLSSFQDHNGLLLPDMSPATLNVTASLDPSTIDSEGIGSPIYSGYDLGAGVLEGVRIHHKEEHLLRAIKSALENATTRAEISQLLDEELKGSAYADFRGKGVNVMTKVCCATLMIASLLMLL